jgi:hypothetical protein
VGILRPPGSRRRKDEFLRGRERIARLPLANPDMALDRPHWSWGTATPSGMVVTSSTAPSSRKPEYVFSMQKIHSPLGNNAGYGMILLVRNSYLSKSKGMPEVKTLLEDLTALTDSLRNRTENLDETTLDRIKDLIRVYDARVQDAIAERIADEYDLDPETFTLASTGQNLYEHVEGWLMGCRDALEQDLKNHIVGDDDDDDDDEVAENFRPGSRA